MFTSHQSGTGGDHVGREEGGLVLDLRTMTKLLFKCFTVSFCVVVAFCLKFCVCLQFTIGFSYYQQFVMSDMYFYPIYHRTYEQRVIVVEKHLLDFIFLELILLMIKTLNLEKIDAHYSSF